MIIKSLSFQDAINNISITNINFDHMTVFVGTSGAGKTTIMNALATIKDIASGASSPGDSWMFEFISDDGKQITWNGKYSSTVDLDKDEEEVASIDFESLNVDGDDIIVRKKDSIIFKGVSLPSLDKYKSMLYLLRDDSLINRIYKSINKIVLISNDCTLHTKAGALRLVSTGLIEQVRRELKKEGTGGIKALEEVKVTCRERIYFSKMYDRELFDQFMFIYSSIFPNVREVKVELKHRYNKLGSNSTSAKSVVFISLELESGEVIPQHAISSGMFKSMMILADLILGNSKEVMIIDEIENSLGVNCLPDVITEMKSAQVQCIFSTHHPRIISNVPTESWQIVNRTKGTISCYKSEELINSKSKHDKFIQLMNHEIFLNGNV